MTNNLISNIMIDGTKNIVPEVGMGATECSYTDRRAATISEVFVLRGVTYIGVQLDIATRTDDYGMSDIQEYSYERNPNSYTSYYRFRNGNWEAIRKNPETGRWIRYDGNKIIVGRRDHYHDFSF